MDVDPIARLLEVTRSISRVLDLDELLQLILNHAVEMAGAERGYLILVNPDESLPLEERLQVKAAYRMSAEELLTEEFSASRTAIWKVVQSGSGHHKDNALEEPKPSRSVELFGLRSILCEPLKVQNRLVGVLYLDSRMTSRFTPWCREIVPSLAAQAAVSIENAQLIKEREEALKREHAEHLHAREMETWKNAMAAFVSIASHDLKNPLTVLGNGLQLLERYGLPEQSKELVEDMKISLGRARRLVEMYLDCAALQEGRQLTVRTGEVPLRELVDVELELVRSRLSEEKRKRYQFVNAVGDHRAWADPDRLQQVVGNLLDNAVKYARGRVEVRSGSEGERVWLEISDEGPGIAPENLERLFDRYFRVDTPGGARGTGLGLWIARQLVESMGGAIQACSEVGFGTTFRVSLPIFVPALQTRN